MNAGQEGIDADIGKEDRDEADNGKNSGCFPLPAPVDPQVQVGCVDDPGDQGPGLLGVP